MIRLQMKGTLGQYKRMRGGYACLNHLIHCNLGRPSQIHRLGRSVKRISGVYETTGRSAHPTGKVGRRGKVQPCSRAWRCGKWRRAMSLRYHERGGPLSPN